MENWLVLGLGAVCHERTDPLVSEHWQVGRHGIARREFRLAATGPEGLIRQLTLTLLNAAVGGD